MEKIILASGSPRRKEILDKYNLNPLVIKSQVSEIINDEEAPEQIAMTLAFRKSIDVSRHYADYIVIGADTIVVYEDQVLGKPTDKEDAFRMLSLLSGKTHRVITGVSIIKESVGIKIVDYDTTYVKFKYLSEDRIRNYINTNEYADKAGSYGIQGLGGILVEKIDGCYFNVVGLPLTRIDYILSRYFNFKII